MLNSENKILVVDDEKIIGRAFVKEFQPFGVQIDVAYDAHAAYRLAKEKQYDLIFIDLILPGMDGIQLCRQIRPLQENAKMIFMTGNTDTDPIYKEMEFVDAGGCTYQLYKPFIEGELIEIAGKALAS